MEPVTRRSFLVKGGVGAAGAATAFGAGWKLSSADASEAALSPDELEALDGPLLVQVKDAAAGEVELLVGERSVQFTDKALVAKLLRASR
ncbi:MAG TPA: twin-arginine translocation signal domain-containing protein [Acidimicrobiales bacterium]|jgi:3-hydroxyisobutyrate dehydrogenase-like beta-hydroxyacid dehydrogenase|nr:twin-arginine translocation signal domain-containing protein [Acidimicrobiales bacterium]